MRYRIYRTLVPPGFGSYPGGNFPDTGGPSGKRMNGGMLELVMSAGSHAPKEKRYPGGATGGISIGV
jgi:hypothetical protein